MAVLEDSWGIYRVGSWEERERDDDDEREGVGKKTEELARNSFVFENVRGSGKKDRGTHTKLFLFRETSRSDF